MTIATDHPIEIVVQAPVTQTLPENQVWWAGADEEKRTAHVAAVAELKKELREFGEEIRALKTKIRSIESAEGKWRHAVSIGAPPAGAEPCFATGDFRRRLWKLRRTVRFRCAAWARLKGKTAESESKSFSREFFSGLEKELESLRKRLYS